MDNSTFVGINIAYITASVAGVAFAIVMYIFHKMDK